MIYARIYGMILFMVCLLDMDSMLTNVSKLSYGHQKIKAANSQFPPSSKHGQQCQLPKGGKNP
jgi:hypothetical protein